MIRKSFIFIFLYFLFVQNIEACSVCFSAKEGTRTAFYVTTAMLTFVPLIMISFTAYWLFKRSKALELKTK